MLIGGIRHMVVIDMTKYQTVVVVSKSMPVDLNLNLTRLIAG